MSAPEVSKTKYIPLYQYTDAVRNLIPALGHYPSPEEARKIAKRKEEEIKRITNNRPFVGGRAGR